MRQHALSVVHPTAGFFGVLDVLLQLTARPLAARLLRAGRSGKAGDVSHNDITKTLLLVLSFLHLGVQVSSNVCGWVGVGVCVCVCVCVRERERESTHQRVCAHMRVRVRVCVCVACMQPVCCDSSLRLQSQACTHASQHSAH